MSQPPSSQQLQQVLELLYRNGISVNNSKEAYSALKQYESDPNFAVILGYVFGHQDYPVPAAQLLAGVGSVPWVNYRRLAGITLKNNIERAKTLLGEQAVLQAAQIAVQQLRTPTNAIAILSIAAQLVVKITSITGLDWWEQVGVCNVAGLILDELLTSPQPTVVLGGLYCLQFLMEDVPKQIGAASEVVVQRVIAMVGDTSRDITLRKAAFKVASHPYEIGAQLEWNVEVLSPMQQGLCNASGAFAQCCTVLLSDTQLEFGVIVLQSAVLLLDYTDYFIALGNPQSTHLVASWVGSAVHHLCHAANADVAAAAANFLAYMFEVNERSGGEGAISIFTDAAAGRFPQIIPKLFEYIALTNEEVDSIAATDHYTHRDAFAVVVNPQGGASGGAALEEDALVDDDEAAITLRRSASSCLDKACVSAPQAASELVLAQIQARWGHADWKAREAALLGFGSSVRGCYASMAANLAAIVPHIQSYIDDPTQHPCVVSMSIWCIQRLASWLVTDGRAYSGALFQSILRRMTSESKRVQASTVSALKVLFSNGVEANYEFPQSFLSEAVQAVHQCVATGLYNTGNLSALCDVSLYLLGLLPDTLVDAFAQPFFTRRADKMTAFEQSYAASVVEGNSNIMIDKDVMFLDRVAIAVLQRSPNTNQHLLMLTTWASVLWDIASRGAYDDADLVFNSIYTASHLIRTLDSANLMSWLSSRQFDVVKSVLQILEVSPPNSYIRCSCFTLVYQLVNVGRAQCLQDAWIVQTAYRCGLLFLNEAADDDAMLLASIAHLLTLLIRITPNEDSLRAVLALCGKLRSDCFAETLDFHLAVAFDLCGVLEEHPTLLPQLPVTTVCKLLATSPNSLTKSMGTISLCRCICSPQIDVSASFGAEHVHDLLRLVYSWQQAAQSFQNGTHEALVQLLQKLRSTASLCPYLQQEIGSLPEGYRLQLCQTYGLQ